MLKKIFGVAMVFSLLVSFAMLVHAQNVPPKITKAVFAGGCFWCMESEFQELDGVLSVVSGYTGGHVDNPTYAQVSQGTTGHVEAVEITYDAHKLSYVALLDIFWSNVDPTDAEGQFCDKGSQYVAGIFYMDATQQKSAEKSLTDVEQKLGQKVQTFIRPAVIFYPAEEGHQDYYKKNTIRYKSYKYGCGRDARLKQIWEQ